MKLNAIYEILKYILNWYFYIINFINNSRKLSLIIDSYNRLYSYTTTDEDKWQDWKTNMQGNMQGMLSPP